MRVRRSPLLISAPLLAYGLVACLVAACGPAIAAPPTATPALPSALTALIPGDPELVLVVHPAAALRFEATRRVFEIFVPPTSAQRLADRVGVRPEHIQDLVYADYGRGFIALLRAPRDMREVVVATEMRMNTVEVTASEPFERRVGYLGTERREVVALDENVLLVAGGSAGAEVASLLAEVCRLLEPTGERGRSEPSSFDGAFARPVMRSLELLAADDAALYFPSGLHLPPSPLALLFARTEALALTLRPDANSADFRGFRLRAASVGPLPPGAEANLRALLASMAASDFGAALGLEHVRDSLSLEVRESGEAAGATLEARWPLEALLRGLELLVAPDVRALLEIAEPGPD